MANHATRTLTLTVGAMLAFAANTLLCRAALAYQLIDAASFTSVRAISGAAMLGLIVLLQQQTPDERATDWRSTLALLVYMVTNSFAYLAIGVGTGALILFTAVQLTMFIAALRHREHVSPWSWGGLALAILGVVYLVSPGLAAPDPFGAALMAISGAAWGFYSLLGRGVKNPLRATAMNFLLIVPPVLIVSAIFWSRFNVTPGGVALAAASGALASGVGYAIWYAALSGLTASRAATVQLSVPALSAFGGVVLLAEPLTLRLLLASAATLGGVAIVLTQRATKAPPP
jgi:drug/metabolite transporter (DMT)-like permease